MTAKQPHQKETVLLHLLPARILAELAARAESLRREEAFRQYALKRMWFILPMSLLIFVLGLVSAGAVVLAFVASWALLDINTSTFEWFVMLGLAALAFACTIVYLLNDLFAWLEEQAASNYLSQPTGQKRPAAE